MGKPRVVIADAEEAYLAALQQKFIETFFDRIDLEIITEKPYFDFLFSAPQKMDILVVSEEFYFPAAPQYRKSVSDDRTAGSGEYLGFDCDKYFQVHQYQRSV